LVAVVCRSTCGVTFFSRSVRRLMRRNNEPTVSAVRRVPLHDTNNAEFLSLRNLVYC
jgi:hypothetical protein